MWADKEAEQGPFHADFKLSATNGDTVSLIDPMGNLIDQVTVPPIEDDDVSYARQGTGDDWTLSDMPTPGRANP